MSKDLNKTKEEIMSRIHKGQVKMRPKMYFVFGYIFSILGLVFSFTTSVFLVGIIRFSLRSHGPMGQYRFEKLLSTFSWWMPLLAIAGLVSGILILRKYDFSYKINFKLLIMGLITSVILAGFVIDMTGMNNFLMGKGRGGQGYGQLRGFNNYNNR